VTATYLNVGKIRVQNDAWPTATNPGDVVYVDMIGHLRCHPWAT
jgi:hypothetical protein